MPTHFIPTTYGAPATAALAKVMLAIKSREPLAQSTVIVPANLVGVSARRLLAARISSGLAGVRFETLLSLARRLAAPSISLNLRPITNPVVGAAVRSALKSSSDLLRPVAHHPATEKAMIQSYRELRELDEEDLSSLSELSPRAAEIVRLHREIYRQLADDYIDEVDIHQAARSTVASGHPLIDDLGSIVLHIPDRFPKSGVDLISALSSEKSVSVILALTGDTAADAPIQVLVRHLGGELNEELRTAHKSRLLIRSVADPEEEIRLAIREVIEGAGSGIAFNQMAISHPGTRRYAHMIHQHLAAAEIPFNGVAGQRLSESLAARTLLSLLSLSEQDLSRTAVMSFLSSGVVLGADGQPVPVAAWEKLAREARVVSGLSQWQERLDQYSIDQEARLVELKTNKADASHLQKISERIQQAKDLLGFIQSVDNDLADKKRPNNWSGLTKWATKLLDRYLGAPTDLVDWPPDEIDAYNKVGDLLRSLAGLGRIETAPSLENFRRAVADGLNRDISREGRYGTGVFVGGFGSTAGLDLERVIVVGLAEGTTPPRQHEDPLLPDTIRRALNGRLLLTAERQSDLHRSVLATFAAGSINRVLTFARGDLGSRSATLPSRWLLDEVEAELGERPSPAQLEDLTVDWFKTSSSFSHSLEQLENPADPHEYALAELLREFHSGLPLDISKRRSNDSVLNRGIELLRAREAPELTKFDGLLDNPELLFSIDKSTILTATSLEAWVECPYAYFMRHILAVGTVEDPADEDGMTSLVRGSLMHRILDRFLNESINANDLPYPEVPWSPIHHQRMDQICEEEFTLVESRGLTGRTLLWQRESNQLRQALSKFLLDDDKRRKDNMLTPVASEIPFGLEGVKPLILHLSNERSLRFRGRIDRVDRDTDGSLFVTDFKTGKRRDSSKISENSPTLNGRYLQLPLYGLAARELLGTPNTHVETQYWFLLDGGTSVGHLISDLVLKQYNQTLTTITDDIGKGIFPARPPESSYGVGCDYCNPDGLGFSYTTELWQRKRHDPRLNNYRHLLGELGDDSGTASTGHENPSV